MNWVAKRLIDVVGYLFGVAVLVGAGVAILLVGCAPAPPPVWPSPKPPERPPVVQLSPKGKAIMVEALTALGEQEPRTAIDLQMFVYAIWLYTNEDGWGVYKYAFAITGKAGVGSYHKSGTHYILANLVPVSAYFGRYVSASADTVRMYNYLSVPLP